MDSPSVAVSIKLPLPSNGNARQNDTHTYLYVLWGCLRKALGRARDPNGLLMNVMDCVKSCVTSPRAPKEFYWTCNRTHTHSLVSTI
jgi:hypothetical protein